MSRDLQNQQGYYGDRYLPKPQMSNGPVYSTDPAGYVSRTANSNGWRAQRAFDDLKPYEGGDRPDYLDSPTLRPMHSLHHHQGSRRPTTPLDDKNTGRSVHNTRHSSRPEERASELYGPTTHGSPKPRRSEARGFEDFGEEVVVPTRTCRAYSMWDEEEMIDFVKAGKTWRQISEAMHRTEGSVKHHWNRILKHDIRATGVVYAPRRH